MVKSTDITFLEISPPPIDLTVTMPDGSRAGLFLEVSARSPRITFADATEVVTDDDVLVAMRAFKRGRNAKLGFSQRMRAALNAFVGAHLER